MNCEDCKEQVFELIEREARDPDAVREILARCPDCRIAFEEMKAALRLGAQLAIEEPRAEVDAAILRAASDRAPGVAPLRKRLVSAPRWAVAAIALLAVGVGVLAIPQGVERESQRGPGEQDAADSSRAEQAFGEKPMPMEEDEVARPRPDPEPAAVARSAERVASKTRMVDAKRPPAKRSVKPTVEQPEVEPMGAVPATGPAAEEAARAVAERGSADADVGAPAADEHEGIDRVMARCRRQVAALEHRKRDGRDDLLEPEEELANGKCYQVLGDVAEARRWLKRAAGHRETRARAEEALRELAPE